jgi:hypothetical protein
MSSAFDFRDPKILVFVSIPDGRYKLPLLFGMNRITTSVLHFLQLFQRVRTWPENLSHRPS